MISASCPSCASPLVFAHAASLTAVCGACDSTVVRDDVSLRDLGKLAPFVRELSPLQVGATGAFAGRAFRVAGGLRRVRPGVRWNEWYLVFDDGAVGWLGEGNGQLQIFATPPLPVPELNAPPAVGQKQSLGGADWTVSEVSEAALAAGVGELPFAPTLGAPVPYADLRGANGAVGTLDWASGQTVLYVGVAVDIVALKLEGLRAFAGWSDPVLVAFQGPELEPSRTLACPTCSAPVVLRAPGDAARTTCLSCGSVIGHSEAGAALIEALRQKPRSFRLKLGARGLLDGVPWELLGLLERYVIEEGVRYSWTEYLLHNPYRGYRWLVRSSSGDWTSITLLTTPPKTIDADTVMFEGQRYTVENRGAVYISYVLGELTWEAKVGDRVESVDYKAGRRSLSLERSDDEITWSVGEPISTDTVLQAFDPDSIEPTWKPPAGPSPYLRGARLWMTLLCSLFAGGVSFVGCAAAASGGPTVFAADSTMGNAEAPYVSEIFTLPPARNGAVNLYVRSSAAFSTSLINLDNGELYERVAWDGHASIFARPEPGRYVVRASRAEGDTPVSVSVKLTMGGAAVGPFVFVGLWSIVGPFLLALFHVTWYFANGTRERLPAPAAPKAAPGASTHVS